MAIATFNIAEFQQVLNAHAHGWTHLGIIQNEHCFYLPQGHGLGLLVRSSIGESGVNDGAGLDSIRAYIATSDGQFWGGKTVRWIDRRNGWERRLGDTLSKLTEQLQYCRPCPHCSEVVKPFTSKKEQSKGKQFVKCCNDACPSQRLHGRAFFVWVGSPFQCALCAEQRTTTTEPAPACPVCNAPMVRMARGTGWKCSKSGRWDGKAWSGCGGTIFDKDNKKEKKPERPTMQPSLLPRDPGTPVATLTPPLEGFTVNRQGLLSELRRIIAHLEDSCSEDDNNTATELRRLLR